jgi:hypothetical protein
MKLYEYNFQSKYNDKIFQIIGHIINKPYLPSSIHVPFIFKEFGSKKPLYSTE